MDNPILELLIDIPEGLQPLTSMERPNQPIIIHEGVFRLSTDISKYECSGKIQYVWIPSRGIKFSADIESSQQLLLDYRANIIFHVCVGEDVIGRGFLTNLSTSSIGGTTIGGQLEEKVFTGDITIMAECIRFEIPNLRSFLG